MAESSSSSDLYVPQQKTANRSSEGKQPSIPKALEISIKNQNGGKDPGSAQNFEKVNSKSPVEHNYSVIPSHALHTPLSSKDKTPCNVYWIVCYRITLHVLLLYCVLGVTYLLLSQSETSPFYTNNNDNQFTKTYEPTVQPTTAPLIAINNETTNAPSIQPSVAPTFDPLPSASSETPSHHPSQYPSWSPSKYPSEDPSIQPTADPSLQPTEDPSMQPTKYPSLDPSMQPTAAPSVEPTTEPSPLPTLLPTIMPTISPTMVGIQGTADRYTQSSIRFDAPGTTTLLFPIVRSGNAANEFNTVNGRFTAPVSGVYAFTVGVESNAGADSELWYTFDGVLQRETFAYGSDTVLVGSIVINMAQNQYITFEFSDPTSHEVEIFEAPLHTFLKWTLVQRL